MQIDGARTLSSAFSSARAVRNCPSVVRCVMITSGTIVALRRSPLRFGGFVLDHARQADRVPAEDVGDVGHHVRTVIDVEPQVVTTVDVGDRLQRERRLLGPQVEPAERDGRPSDRDVDDVRDDGRGGRHLTGARTGVPRRADGVAGQRDHVVRAVDLRQRAAVPDQRRLDVHLQLALREPRGRQQLDRIAQLVGVHQVGRLDRVDPLHRKLPGQDARAEGQLREDRQLLGRVGAVDVHRRVGLGVAEPLRFGGPCRRTRRACGTSP